MRAMRSTFTTMLMLGLLASPTVTLADQEDQPPPLVFVTGIVVEQFDHGGQQGAPPASVRGWQVSPERAGLIEQVVEWSDPRLPSRHWMELDLTIVTLESPEPEGAMAVTTSNLLEGPEGSWRGTGRAIEDGDDRYSLYEFTGDGTYEGLWAVLRGTPGLDAHGPWDHSYEGYIFELDPMATPAPPKPVATQGVKTFPFPVELDE
jgi:hypothetical protein